MADTETVSGDTEGAPAPADEAGAGMAPGLEGEPDAGGGDPELEPGSGEPGEQGDPAAGDSPSSSSPPSSELDVEQKLKKIGDSAKRFRARVDEVLGEDALAFVPCELCDPNVPGFHLALDYLVAAPEQLDELRRRLVAVLAEADAPTFRPSAKSHRCEACDGLGRRDTGSKVPNQDTELCDDCRGFGYQPPPPIPGSGQAAGTPAPVAGVVEPPPAQLEDRDPFGSPRLLLDGQPNPNYGKMPQFKDASLP